MTFKSVKKITDFLRFHTMNSQLFSQGSGLCGRVSVQIILGIIYGFVFIQEVGMEAI
jgi:hypothetical protein